MYDLLIIVFDVFYRRNETIEGFFHASDQVEAMYEPEGIWYVAKIVKGVKTATAANTEKGPAFDSYMIRYTEYPDEGPFRG